MSLPVRLADRLLSLLDVSIQSLHCFEYHGFSRGTEMHQQLSNTREEVAFLIRIGFARGPPTAVSPLTSPLAASSPLLFLCASSASVHTQPCRAPSPAAPLLRGGFLTQQALPQGPPESARGAQLLQEVPSARVSCHTEGCCRPLGHLPSRADVWDGKEAASSVLVASHRGGRSSLHSPSLRGPGVFVWCTEGSVFPTRVYAFLTP